MRMKITKGFIEEIDDSYIYKSAPSCTRLYSIWENMIYRCYNKNATKYELWGGKGIRVCHEWKEFHSFKEWAHINGYKENLTLERINSDKNYCPENCCWATYKEQNAHVANQRAKNKE